MMPRQPGHEKIESTSPPDGTDPLAPPWPLRDQFAEAEQAHDLRVGSVLEQPNRSPPPIQTTEGPLAAKQRPKHLLVDVVVPDVGEGAWSHEASVPEGSYACTCGGKRVGAMAPVAFAVDVMLGRLARWLRIIGHDVAYGPHLHGPGLVAAARAEGRLILTRDTQLVRDPNLPPHLFLRSDRFRDQLREVAATVPLARGASFTRCVECNAALRDVPRDSVQGRVPPYVLETQERFWTCPACHRVYWPATHHARMRAELVALGLGEGA